MWTGICFLVRHGLAILFTYLHSLKTTVITLWYKIIESDVNSELVYVVQLT